MPCPSRAPAVLCRGLEKSLSERHGRSTARAWHGMAYVNQTRPHCVNQMGKTQSKPLATRHGHSMVYMNQTRPHCVNQMGKTQSKAVAARHGHSMAYVNQTRPHSVNQMGKTQSKPLAARHGHVNGICESDTVALCKSNGKDTI